MRVKVLESYHIWHIHQNIFSLFSHLFRFFNPCCMHFKILKLLDFFP
jgi:hypothetical protein